MFKERCPRCQREVKKSFTFCPYCSCNLNKEREMRDFGFLGKEDDNELFNESFGVNLNMNDIFSSMNSLIKDMAKNFGNEKPFSKAISIKLSPGKKPIIEKSGFGEEKTQRHKSIKPKNFSGENLKKFLKLPKSEPETEVRRLSNKIIYELNLPGVKKKDNIIINKLERGFEIKALSEKMSYVKSIPLDIQLIKAKFDNEKLFLEFNA